MPQNWIIPKNKATTRLLKKYKIEGMKSNEKSDKNFKCCKYFRLIALHRNLRVNFKYMYSYVTKLDIFEEEEESYHSTP